MSFRKALKCNIRLKLCHLASPFRFTLSISKQPALPALSNTQSGTTLTSLFGVQEFHDGLFAHVQSIFISCPSCNHSKIKIPLAHQNDTQLPSITLLIINYLSIDQYLINILHFFSYKTEPTSQAQISNKATSDMKITKKVSL